MKKTNISSNTELNRFDSVFEKLLCDKIVTEKIISSIPEKVLEIEQRLEYPNTITKKQFLEQVSYKTAEYEKQGNRLVVYRVSLVK